MLQQESLPISIDHDWSRIRKVYQKLVDNYQQGFFSTSCEWIDAYKAYGADIGCHGRLSMSDRLTGQPWFIWSGSLLERLLPFATELKTTWANHGLNFCNFSYTQHVSSIHRHVDGKRDAERTAELDPLMNQCNVNYVIACQDPDSRSYFEYPDKTCWYPSRPGRAWLMDSSVPHWVDNQGLREVFQIRFHDSYQKIQNYFGQHPVNIRC